LIADKYSLVKKQFDHMRARNGAIERNIGEDLIARARGDRKRRFLGKDCQAVKDKLKLPTLRGVASREGIPLYIVPLDPAFIGRP
jgi:hypothetical protein